MTEPAEKSVAQVLRDAADLLKRTGWTKHAYRQQDIRGHERFCMLGAINRAASHDAHLLANLGARAMVMGVLGGMSIVRFNDHVATRRAKVVAVLLEAAEVAERKGLP